VIQTGDIALYRGAGLFGRLIRWYTKCDINHSAFIVRKEDGFLWKRHSAIFRIFFSSFIEEPLNLTDKGLIYIVRLKYGELFEDALDIERAIALALLRSETLLNRTTPYDPRAVLGIALGPLGKYIGHSERRFMCSEAVSWIWRPEGILGLCVEPFRKSLFHGNALRPHDDITPADILNSPFVEIIWEGGF